MEGSEYCGPFVASLVVSFVDKEPDKAYDKARDKEETALHRKSLLMMPFRKPVEDVNPDRRISNRALQRSDLCQHIQYVVRRTVFPDSPQIHAKIASSKRLDSHTPDLALLKLER